jgi:hypothetical protein
MVAPVAVAATPSSHQPLWQGRVDRAQAAKDSLAEPLLRPAKLKVAVAAGRVLLAATEQELPAALAVQEPHPLSQGRL